MNNQHLAMPCIKTTYTQVNGIMHNPNPKPIIELRSLAPDPVKYQKWKTRCCDERLTNLIPISAQQRAQQFARSDFGLSITS